MDLQTAFYTLGIIFMVIMLLLIAALLVAVVRIRAQILKIQSNIDERIAQVKLVTDNVGQGFRFLKYLLFR